jgi:hypothetical protein
MISIRNMRAIKGTLVLDRTTAAGWLVVVD